MRPGRSARLTDPEDVRFRVAGIRLGLLTTLVVCVFGGIYYLATPDGPNRELLLALSIGFGVTSLASLGVRWEAIVSGRWRDTFFLTWSFGCTSGMALCLYLDGVTSVNAFGLALPLAYAGLLYPLRGAIAIALFDLALLVLVGVLNSQPWPDLLFATALLGCMAAMCVWTAWWQARQRDALARLSRTDPLTGCLNRRGIEDRVQQAVDDGTPFALLTLDLDDFKTTNDRDGHAAGDAVLCAAVRGLVDAVRPTDAVGRTGGDEFAVLLPGATPDVAARVRDRATLALSITAPASFGLAAYPADGTTLDGLFQHADVGVYREKAQRRGRAYGAATEGPAPARP